jgi:hypothetical protein
VYLDTGFSGLIVCLDQAKKTVLNQ